MPCRGGLCHVVFGEFCGWWCGVALCHTSLCRVAYDCVSSCGVAWLCRRVVSWRVLGCVVWRLVVSCCAGSCHVALCVILWRFVLWCNIVLCCVVLCGCSLGCGVPCFVTLPCIACCCCVLPCGVLCSCYVVWCVVTCCVVVVVSWFWYVVASGARLRYVVVLELSNVALVFHFLCLHYHFDLPLHACFN